MPTVPVDDQSTASAAVEVLAGRFHYAACVGVLHHVPDPFAALQGLSDSLLPGGVLQLATYSAISVQTWRPAARLLLHELAPDLVDPSGELRRRPSDLELQSVRRKIFELAEEGPAGKASRLWGSETATTICEFAEFYSAGGTLDLLFHPLERTFTLLQLDDMLSKAGLQPIGVFFANSESDSVARAAYRKHEGGRWALTDPEQAKLPNWHALELKHKELFGRMHILYSRKI
jgi:SAM-dependent methyltransferase